MRKYLKAMTVISFLAAMIILPALQTYASTIVGYDYEEQSNGDSSTTFGYTINAEWATRGVGGTVYGTHTVSGDKFFYIAYAAIATYDDYYGYKVLIGAGFGKVGVAHEGSAYAPCSIRGYRIHSRTFPYGYPVINYWDDSSKNYIEYIGKVLRYQIVVDKVACPDELLTFDLTVHAYAAKSSYSGGPHSISPNSSVLTMINAVSSLPSNSNTSS